MRGAQERKEENSGKFKTEAPLWLLQSLLQQPLSESRPSLKVLGNWRPAHWGATWAAARGGEVVVKVGLAWQQQWLSWKKQVQRKSEESWEFVSLKKNIVLDHLPDHQFRCKNWQWEMIHWWAGRGFWGSGWVALLAFCESWVHDLPWLCSCCLQLV
jgi:hypothetical protein